MAKPSGIGHIYGLLNTEQQKYEADPASYVPPGRNFTVKDGRVRFVQEDPMTGMQKLFVAGTIGFATLGAGAAIAGAAGAGAAAGGGGAAASSGGAFGAGVAAPSAVSATAAGSAAAAGGAGMAISPGAGMIGSTALQMLGGALSDDGDENRRTNRNAAMMEWAAQMAALEQKRLEDQRMRDEAAMKATQDNPLAQQGHRADFALRGDLVNQWTPTQANFDPKTGMGGFSGGMQNVRPSAFSKGLFTPEAMANAEYQDFRMPLATLNPSTPTPDLSKVGLPSTPSYNATELHRKGVFDKREEDARIERDRMNRMWDLVQRENTDNPNRSSLLGRLNPGVVSQRPASSPAAGAPPNPMQQLPNPRRATGASQPTNPRLLDRR